MEVIPGEQKPPDLEAIRADVDLYERYDFDSLVISDYDAFVLAESFLRGDVAGKSAVIHIRALLAEVERLRAKYEPPPCGEDCEHKREAERTAAAMGGPEIRQGNRAIERYWKYKRGTRGKLPQRIRNLSRYTSRELLAELGRRRHKKLKQNAPELVAERERKSKAVAAIRKKYCDHSKLAPKLRAGGRHAGEWCCPSCSEPVSADILALWKSLGENLFTP